MACDTLAALSYTHRMGSSGLFIYPNDPDNQPPPGMLRALKLHRVLPIAESRPITDGDITLVSLEMYEDGSILSYFVVGNEDVRRSQVEHNSEMARLARSNEREALRRHVEANPMARLGRNLYIRIEDELGSSYFGLPRGSSGDTSRMEASYGFTPAVPAETTQLRVFVYEGDYQRDTGEATKHDPEHLIQTFEITL